MLVPMLLPLVAAAASNPSPSYVEARKLYYEGADGNKNAFERADKIFSALYEQNPNVPRVKVYYGSLRLLEAARTWAPWRKFSLSKEGITLLDGAVAAAPHDLEVRFVRAATTYELPGVFHRREQCAQDFEYLAKKAEQAARTGALEPRLAAASLYFEGEFLADAKQTDEAEVAWRRAIAIAPESRAARDSRRELSKTGS